MTRLERVEAATPSFAVEVLGLNDVPAAGDEFEVYPDEKSARARGRSAYDRAASVKAAAGDGFLAELTLNSLSAKAQEGDLKELNLLL